MIKGIEIPYGCYWSTPFVRWQGSFSHLHSLRFAAHITRQELGKRNIDALTIDYGVLGMTRPEKGAFYGLPYFSGLAGLGHIGGPTLSQACATGARTILAAVQEINSGLSLCAIAVTCDRTSNGPHIYYPKPGGPGGSGESEDFILDNMACDPLGQHSMTLTAENVATKYKIDTAEQHEVVLCREEQYKHALQNHQVFQRRYMTLPFDVPDQKFKKMVKKINGDEGFRNSNLDELSSLSPVLEGGSVTFGGQTYPCDGNAGVIVATEDVARELTTESSVRIRLLGFGLSRTELAFMPEAPLRATDIALKQANLQVTNIDAVKTHNPFAVNDVVLAKEMGFDIYNINNFGCSLVYGHPNAPTGMRGTIELIEELALKGGGIGLFTGCAAGDTAMSIILRVDC